MCRLAAYDLVNGAFSVDRFEESHLFSVNWQNEIGISVGLIDEHRGGARGSRFWTLIVLGWRMGT